MVDQSPTPTPTLTAERPSAARYHASDRVLVRNRFDGGWCAGFEVAEVVVFHQDRPPRYRLRRLSDSTVLPAQFGEDELSPTH